MKYRYSVSLKKHLVFDVSSISRQNDPRNFSFESVCLRLTISSRSSSISVLEQRVGGREEEGGGKMKYAAAKSNAFHSKEEWNGTMSRNKELAQVDLNKN